MKRFSMLYCREFSFRVWQVWLLGLAALGSQPLLFSFSELWSGRRFEQAYDGSGAPAAAVILVGLAAGWMVYSTLRDFRGGIDALLTLPARRGWIYLAKMAAFASMLLVLWAGLLGGVFVSYGWYLLQIGTRAGMWPMENGLLLAFCRSGVLRLLFPPDVSGIFSNLLMLTILAVGSCYASFSIAAKRVWGLIPLGIAGLCWVQVFRARLGNTIDSFPAPWWQLGLLAAAVFLVVHSLWIVRKADF